MTGDKLKILGVVFLLIAALLSIASRFIVNIKLATINLSLSVADRLNMPEEVFLASAKIFSALQSMSKGLLSSNLGSVCNSWIVLVEVVFFALAGIVFLIASVSKLSEDKLQVLALIAGVLLLVGSVEIFYLYFKKVELLSAAARMGSYMNQWLLGFVIIGLGLILYGIHGIIQGKEQTLAFIAAILILVSGVLYLVSRLLAMHYLGMPALSLAARGGGDLYYTPFLAALLLLIGSLLELAAARSE